MMSLGNRPGALPYSVLFGRNGNAVYLKSGEFSRQELEKMIENHL